MVKYPPANAGDMSSIPSPGSSDAAGGATESLSHNYQAHALQSMFGNKRSHCNKNPAQCNEK